MSSLHSTLTVLIDALVRDILQVVRESSVHELVGVGGGAVPSRSPRALKVVAPPLPSRRRGPRADVAKSRTPKPKQRHAEPATPAPTKRRGRRAATQTPSAVLAPPSGVAPADAGEAPMKDDAQITDPGALLRETAVAAPTPRPWASEMPVTGNVARRTEPTLREGEALLRTPSGGAVLRRRRDG